MTARFRSYRAIIQQAELAAMLPEAVARFLADRADQSKEQALVDPVDESAEEALRLRGDPLIELSLARFGRNPGVVTALFRGAAPGSALRLACLSNSVVAAYAPLEVLPALVGDSPASLVQWLQSASADELSALFDNPALGDSFLADLLRGKDEWASVPDETLRTCVNILCGNRRMWTARADTWMDGYAEYCYDAVFDAAWGLAARVPVNEKWALTLGVLYEKLIPEAFSISNPLKLAERWHLDPTDGEGAKQQASDLSIGFLSSMQQVRRGLVRLALRRDGKLLGQLLDSEDIAYRCAGYSAGSLTPQQLQAAYERDGAVAYHEALHASSLWRREETRQVLREMAWDLVKKDKSGDLLEANRFNRFAAAFRKENPQWFADEDAAQSSFEEDEGRAPASRADVTSLANQVQSLNQRLDTIAQGLKFLGTRTGWIWWFSLGALAASLIAR